MFNEALDYSQEESVSTFQRLDELMKQNYPPIEWIVEGMIPEESISILSAKPASFKTWLAFDLAIKVASGQAFLETFKTKQTGVLIIDGESGARQLKSRFMTLGYINEYPIYYKTYCGGKKFDEDDILEIRDYCLEKEIGLIIIDSFARFSGLKDENSATDVAESFRRFGKLKSARLAVVFISHTRKSGLGYNPNGIDSVRGSSDIVASCDIHLSITRKPKSNTVLISQFKNRLDEEIASFRATFIKDSTDKSHWEYAGEETLPGLDDDSDKELILEIVELFPEINQKQIREQLKTRGFDIGEKRLRKLLRELEASKHICCERGERNELLYKVLGEEKTQNG